MKRNKILSLLIVVIVILVIVILVLLFKKGIPLTSNNKKVVDAYKLVSNDTLEYCNGLAMYDSKEVTKDTISNDIKICLSYIKTDSKESVVLEKDKKNKSCTFGENQVFATDDYEGEICTVDKISIDKINAEYKNIFGSDLKDYDTFDLDCTTVCYYKDGAYYCGLKTEYTCTFGAEPHAYRTIKSSYEKDDTLTIYDYFLKIVGNKCKDTYLNSKDVAKCPYGENTEIDYKFLKKYGSVYKHTFKKSDTGYYWVSSKLG